MASQSKSSAATNGGASKGKGKKSKLDYTSDGVTDNNVLNLPSSDWQLLGLLTIVASVVRLFRLSQPTSVVFDEVHFGGFASKYIKGKFFMDVHPPLAKLLITLAGWAAGFDGGFDFKDIGLDYLEPNVPYVAMRLLPAVLGILSIPVMFLTLKALGCRTMTAALGGLLIIFENGLVTQSRLILLDSPLLIFTALTGLSWANFINQHELGPSKAFKPSWWFWLFATGLSLGATVSSKWVGLFTIAWVGSLTIIQLWVLLGDTQNVTPRLWFKHFFARLFCLIVVPVTFYLAMFAIHFVCLVNPGDGDGFMSSEFQATLNSKGLAPVAADVAYGSRITLRHHNTQGGYLHSHNHMYETGSKQQQVTLYPHKDENNIFLLENSTQPMVEGSAVWAENGTLLNATFIEGYEAWDNRNLSHIEDGAFIRLYHLITHRRIHSHDVRAPVTDAEYQQEVSAYGYEGFEGDANDVFRVEIVKSMSRGEESKKRLRTIETKFKLVHMMTGCTLFSHKVKLPEWGFEQQEVTCAKGGTLPNSIWYIESNEHPQLGEDSEKVTYNHPGFLGKFWELQKVMWRTNAGLTESHTWDSRPGSWPLLLRGINFWGKDHRQIYLIGNPLIWWTSTLAILFYAAVKGLAVIRWQRSCGDYSHTPFKRFDYEIGTIVLAWAFHYFPFFLMDRQLFLHHYFPALYFAIMALCQVYDHISHRAIPPLKDRPYIGQFAATVFLALSVVVFTLYAPLTYGNKWTQNECKRVKLFDKWDWDCNNFYPTYNDYVISAGLESTSAAVAATEKADEQVAVGGEQVLQEEPQAEITPRAEGQPYVEGEDRIISREEAIEYRDENGNLLNEEQVAALQGKVSFSTRYETRTRIVDADGNELYEGPADQPIKLPGGQDYEQLVKEGAVKNEEYTPREHPEAEGQDTATAAEAVASEASPSPAAAEVPVEAEAESQESEVSSLPAEPEASEVPEETKGEL